MSSPDLVAVADVRRNRVQLVAGGRAKELHGSDGDDADQGDQKDVLNHGGSVFFADKAAHKGVKGGHDSCSFPILGDLMPLLKAFNIAP